MTDPQLKKRVERLSMVGLRYHATRSLCPNIRKACQMEIARREMKDNG